MPLYEGDVSEYTTPRSTGVTRLVVEISPLASGARAVSARIDDEPQGSTAMAAQAFDRIPTEPARSRLRTSSGDDESGEQVGRRLFAALFSGTLSRVWARAAERGQRVGGLEVVIASDDLAVHALPWELLFDPVVLAGHVILRDRWSVTRRRPSNVRPAPGPPELPGDLRILVITASIAGYPVDRDGEMIRGSFPAAQVTVAEPVSTSAALTAIKAAAPHIVHVASTGERSRETQVLLIGDKRGATRVSGRDIASALTATRTSLLVLASCETDLLAAEIAASVPSVVGMRGSISDDGCIAFLRGLYGTLASGSTVGQAIGAGRAQQLSFSLSLGDEWALPVAYLPTAGHHVVQAGEPDQMTGLGVGVMPVQIADSDDLQLLQMKSANLQALRAQWEPDQKTAVVPPFVREQIDDLAHEVDQLKFRTRAR